MHISELVGAAMTSFPYDTSEASMNCTTDALPAANATTTWQTRQEHRRWAPTTMAAVGGNVVIRAARAVAWVCNPSPLATGGSRGAATLVCTTPPYIIEDYVEEYKLPSPIHVSDTSRRGRLPQSEVIIHDNRMFCIASVIPWKLRYGSTMRRVKIKYFRCDGESESDSCAGESQYSFQTRSLYSWTY